MRKRFYLLAAMMMAGVGMQAQWEKPIPVGTTDMVTSANANGQVYYLYSKAGDFFYTSGNNWGTQATQGATGSQVYFQEWVASGAEEWDKKTLIIRNFISDAKGWNDVFITGNYLVNDCSGRGNNTWAAEWSGDEVRFYSAKGNSSYDEETYGSRVYIGYVPDDGTTWLQPTAVVDGAEPVDWTLVKSADYDAWVAQNRLYTLAEELKAEIDDTKEQYKDIDLSTVEAVYNNTASTEEALTNAKDEIKTIIKAYAATHGVADEPLDLTSLIVNPDYGKTNSNTGWQGTSMTVSDGCAELWNLKSFDGYQDITGLPNGVYRLNVHGLFRVSGTSNTEYYKDGVNIKPESRVAYLYGRSGDLTSDVQLMDVLDGLSDVKKHDIDFEFAPGKWGPNRRAGFTIYNEDGLYSANTVYVPVTDGTLRIGVEAKSIVPSESWCVFDDWNIAFCGNTSASYDLWRTDYLEKMYIESGVMAQASLLTPFREAEETATTATSPEEITVQYQKMHELYPQLQSSMRAYAAYVKAMDAIKAALDANPMASSEPLDLLQDYLNESVEPGSTYVNGTYEYITEHCLLDEDALLAEAAYADSLYARARKLDVKEGTDITELLKNPDMSQANYEGWNPTAEITADFNSAMGQPELRVAQAFNTKFEISQKVSDIPDGLYKLELNGMFRPSDSQSTEESPVVLFINDFNNPIQNINADAQPIETAVDSVNCFITNAGTWPYDNIVENTGYVPNSVYGCSFAFMGGRYKQTVYGLVTGGEMTIGLRDPRAATKAKGWTVFSNFKLTYMAKNIEAMNEVLESLKDRVNTMVDNQQFCDAQARANAIDIIDKGLAASGAEEKYELLTQANEYMNVLTASVSAYSELATALDYVNDTYWQVATDSGMYVPDAPEQSPEYYTPEYKAAVEFADNTYDVVYANIEKGVYTNEEALALAKQLRLTPVVDIVYVVGDLKDASAWNENSKLYPLKRQADGTYQGTFTGLERASAGGYGNRDMIFFQYQEDYLDCVNEHPRWVSEGRNEIELRTVSSTSQYAAVYGGTWKVTVDADRTKATFEPVDKAIYPDYCYLSGAFADGNWSFNKKHLLVNMGNGQYYGEFEFSEESECNLTLFAGEWAINNSNWSECRVGTSATTDTISAEQYGQPIAGVDRFYGEPQWKLEPGRFSIKFDARAMTVTFTKLEDEIAHAGTAEDPFVVTNLYELAAVRAKLQPGRMNYIVLENDIDMSRLSSWNAFNLAGDMKNDQAFMNWVDFDGKGHVINGFTSTTGNYSSFFGVLCGAVRNVGFPNLDVTCTATGSGALGGYVGHGNYTDATTVVENVWVEGKLHVGSGYCGGLFGNVGGPTNIKNSYANLAITVDNESTTTGGIIGRVSADLNMENVYAAGTVEGKTDTTGVIGGVNSKYTGSCVYKNVCVWNNDASVFGPTGESDIMDGILYYDGTNFQALQQSVVAWDANVWSCTMEEGAYPVLAKVQGTGIGGVNAGVNVVGKSNAIYNLSGQRVQKMQKGIYIQNGRKVLVK